MASAGIVPPHGPNLLRCRPLNRYLDSSGEFFTRTPPTWAFQARGGDPGQRQVVSRMGWWPDGVNNMLMTFITAVDSAPPDPGTDGCGGARSGNRQEQKPS